MTDLTDEEIRAFAIAGGWTPQFDDDLSDSNSGCRQIAYWHAPSCGAAPTHLGASCRFESHRDYILNFRTNLAACFDVLEWFCRDYDIEHRNRKVFTCTVYFPSEEHRATETTKQAAIIRAVLAAQSANQGRKGK